MKSNRYSWLLLWSCGCLLQLAQANPLDALKPLLLDLPGWQAQPVVGLNRDYDHMKMINVSRKYDQGNQSLDASLFITNQASETGWLDSNLQFESAGSLIIFWK